MGSTSNSLASSLAAFFAPVTFNGSSKFSSDFQQVLTRAVAIQSLPLQTMQNQLATLQAQQSDMTGLQTTFKSLQTAIQNIGSSVTTPSAVSSNPTAVTAAASPNTLPGTYTVQVVQMGSSTTTISGPGTPVITDPTTGNISSASTFTLKVDGTNTTITPSGTSLDDLASAINDAAAGVQATVVNVGSNSNPDYRLSVTSNNLGSDTIQLNDGTNNLLTQLAAGTPTEYQVNGLSTVIQSNSNLVTLAPGMTVSLLQQTSSPVTITVAQNTSALGNNISSFATAYNAAVDALTAQHGKDAGSLLGDPAVLTLGQALTSLTEYTGGQSGLTSLADIGLTLDPDTGHLAFNASVLSNTPSDTVQQFLGGISSGGFLQAANDTLNSLTDSTTGVIQFSLNTLQTSITNENTQISDQQDQITLYQQNLQLQLANADAAISVLQQQLTYMGNLFATMYPNVSSTSGGTSSINGG